LTATRQDVLTILEKLVGFNTVSDLSNLALQDYVEAYLRAKGVPVMRVPNAAGDKATLFATIGPQDGFISEPNSLSNRAVGRRRGARQGPGRIAAGGDSPRKQALGARHELKQLHPLTAR